MNSKSKYMALTARVTAAHGGDICDMCIDAQNCGVTDDDSEEFWAAMLVSLHNSAGERLSEAGIDPAAIGIRF